MKFYFAPMEGITGYLFRNVYEGCFGGIDRYFTPFIVPTQNRCFHPRDLKDVLPEHNRGIPLVPQIMSNRSEDFIKTLKELGKMGYDQVNLNLGCPSGTVVSKGRGAGFLARREELLAFLDDIFKEPDRRVSIKTRIGINDPEEFYPLLDLFNQYPLTELIIHPRLQKDYYNNKPNWPVFQYAMEKSINPVCYNGDIFTVDDYEKFAARFPLAERIMLGRGLLKNPELVSMIRGQNRPDKEKWREFHDLLYEAYQKALSGEKTILFKMKELWCYTAGMFTNYERYAKKIKKSEKLWAYEEAVNAIFQDQELKAP